MRMRCRWTVVMVISSAALMGTVAGGAEAEIVLTFDGYNGANLDALGVGATFELALNVSGMTAGDAIDAFSLTESFPDGVFQVLSAVGPGLPGPGGFSASADAASFSLAYTGPTPVTQDGTLVILTLKALSIGSGSFLLPRSGFSAPDGSILNLTGLDPTFAVLAGSAPVPEPSGLALAAAGLAFVGLGRSKARRQPASA